MYAPHFGLKQTPFSIAPDPRYLYMSERHREALAHLLYGVRSGGGFVVLTGEIGAGKTTVCRCFLEQVPAGCQVAYIVNPKLSVMELLQTVAEEFGITLPADAPPGGATVKTLVDALNRYLLDAHAQGRHCLLIVDEAQNLSAEVLEQLRLLTNLETDERKLLQIILIGQPELRGQLASPGLEQLAQRVIARYHLQALSEPETVAYVAHRLAVAGREGASPFEPAALRRVHALTGGVPRRINLLCDRALLGAYAEGRDTVDRRVVERAALEVFGGPADRPPTAPAGGPRTAWALGGAVLAAGLLVVAGRMGWWSGLGAGVDAATGAGAGASASGPASATLAGLAAASAPAGAAAAASASALASAPADAAPAIPSGKAAAASAAVRDAAAVAASPSAPAAAQGPAVAGNTAPAASLALAPGTHAAAPRFDDATDWARLPTSEPLALRELAQAWGLSLPATGAPCALAERAQLACWRQLATSLPLLARLDRPALLALTAPNGRRVHVRLLAVSPGTALLASGGQRWQMPLAQLAARWRGEAVTFWRQPPGYSQSLSSGARGPAVAALAQALAQLDGTATAAGLPGAEFAYDDALRQRVAAFQLAAGLQPDGVAGPTTFMLLNRALAMDEPRLGRE